MDNIFKTTDELLERAAGDEINSHVWTALSHRLAVFKSWRDWALRYSGLDNSNTIRTLDDYIKKIEAVLR